MIGSIMNVMTETRPDLPNSISFLRKYLASPQRWCHLAMAKRVYWYLKHTKNIYLLYSRLQDSRFTMSYGFTDSDWDGDTSDQKSTREYTFLLANAAVSWKFKKQNILVIWSTEAEYIACSEVAKEAIFIRCLFSELPAIHALSISILLYAGNQRAVLLVKNNWFHKCTHHIDRIYHHVCDMIAQGLVSIQHLSRYQMTADILTKAFVQETD